MKEVLSSSNINSDYSRLEREITSSSCKYFNQFDC